MMKKIFVFFPLMILLLLVTDVGSSKTVQSEIAFALQTFPTQAGFPKTEVRGIEFASPSVVDLDGDGQLDILIADKKSCVYAWDSAGNSHPGYPLDIYQTGCSGSPRINNSLAIGDVDGDGFPEIVAGNRGTGTAEGERGRVFVWNHDGTLLPGWPIEMDWNEQYANSDPEIYTVALGNLAGDARPEILAGTSNNSSRYDESFPPAEDNPQGLYAWDASGVPLTGFPAWYRTAGIFGMLGAADITGDRHDEVIVPRDHRWLSVYDGAGANPPGWPIETFVDPSQELLSMTYTRSGPAMGDLDNDGVIEIIMAGKVKERNQGHEILHSGVLVLEPNGERRPGWEIIKLAGTRLSSSYTPDMAPALADLDKDGKLEIVVNLFDGTVRAYRENGQSLWAYDLAQGKLLYPSEPVIGDITGDGELDIVFGAYTNDGNAYGAVGIYALDRNGNLLPGFPLSLSEEGSQINRGIRAAPTLADIDGDGDVEILAGSWAGTFYVWDLPTTYDPELMPWPTGRQNNWRNGSYDSLTPNLHVTPLQLTWYSVYSNTQPYTQTLSIENYGAGSLDWSITTPFTLATLGQTTGTTPSVVPVILTHPVGITATYKGTITITSVTSGTRNSPQSIQVSIYVRERDIAVYLPMIFKEK